MAIPRNYDPGRVTLVVNGQQITGFADGTFIKVSRMTPTFSSKAGAGGEVVRTRSRDKRGKIEITLLPSSSSNDFLSALLATDEQIAGGVGAIGASMLKELNGTTLASAETTWVTQPADLEFAVDPSNRAWVLECADLKMLVGGLLL
jgi:hypothetical protein